ncbi:MAG: RecX family transcriptional regulator [Chloroflexota bacterium]
MAKVTRLTRQKRNKERVNVYLDDEFAFGVTMITAVRLRIGQELSDEEIAKLKIEDSYEVAKQTAMNFITYRPRSVSEVRKNLRGKSFDDETIEKVLNRLIELEMLSDEAFVRYWVDQRTTFKPRSQMALRAELLKKGVAMDAIDAVVSDVDETSAAQQAAQKQMSRWRFLDEETFRKKAMGFLQRRGFRFDIAKETTQLIWETIEAEREEE